MIVAVDVGPVVIVLAMLLLLPALATAGMAVAALLGWVLKAEAEATHPGSELIDLNR